MNQNPYVLVVPGLVLTVIGGLWLKVGSTTLLPVVITVAGLILLGISAQALKRVERSENSGTFGDK